MIFQTSRNMDIRRRTILSIRKNCIQLQFIHFLSTFQILTFCGIAFWILNQSNGSSHRFCCAFSILHPDRYINLRSSDIQIPKATHRSLFNTERNQQSPKDSIKVYRTVSSVQLQLEPFTEKQEDISLQDKMNQDWWTEKIFLGIHPTPEIIAIMGIYFVEGALGLARLAQTFYLKDTLHLGPAESSAIAGIFSLPWTIKPLYGFLSDGVPIFGSRRKSYLILCGFLGALSYAALGSDFWGMLSINNSETTHPFTLLQGSIAALILSSACIAFSDVVADGIVVERTRDSDDPKVAGGLQSLCWGSAAFGGLITAYFSGSLLELLGPKQIFSITSLLPTLVAAIAIFVDEKKTGPVPDNPSMSSSGTLSMDSNGSLDTVPRMEGTNSVAAQMQSLWIAVKEPSVWKPSLFLFLWQSTPTSDGAFLYFMTNELGMGPEFFGRVRLVVSLASFLGVWMYQKFLRTVPIKNILFWSTLVSTPLGLLQLLLITHVNRSLGIPDDWFVFGDDVVLAILGQLAFLPTLVLAAKLCPPGIEAVLFAFLMSLFNGASTVGTEIGAALTKTLGVTDTNFDNLGLLTIICNVSSLYPLFLIDLLNGVGTKSDAELEIDTNKK